MIERSFWRDILCEVISTMDPWDIDITELATRYSERVEHMEEMDFKIPANVILVSSVLLRMKADIIASVEVNPMEFARDLDDDFGFGEFDIGTYSQIETVGVEGNGDVLSGDEPSMEVRPRRVPKRRVTAVELIAAIQEVLEDRAVRQRLKEEGNGERIIKINLSRDIRELIEETYRRVASILLKKKDEFVLFSEIVPTREEIVPTFISLLHLSNNQRVSLKQDRMYEDIFIKAR